MVLPLLLPLLLLSCPTIDSFHLDGFGHSVISVRQQQHLLPNKSTLSLSSSSCFLQCNYASNSCRRSSSTCRQWGFRSSRLHQSSSSITEQDDPTEQQQPGLNPQAFSSGYSMNGDLLKAIPEAFRMALNGMPANVENIDVAWIYVSSLYEGGGTAVASSDDRVTMTASPVMTVPIVLATAQAYNVNLQNMIGCTVAGCISSQVQVPLASDDNPSYSSSTACKPIELEAIPAVTITFAIVPETTITTFHIAAPDLPDDDDEDDDDRRQPISASATKEWKRYLGLSRIQSIYDTTDQEPPPPPPTSFFLIPNPSFSTVHITTLLSGLTKYFPNCQIAGGIASTVSSLSRSKLFVWTSRSGKSNDASSTTCYTDGCIGIAFQGDVQWQTLQAQGAKPVGGIYQIVKGQESTIQLIQFDESATNALKDEEEEEEEVDDDEDEDDDNDQDAKKTPEEAKAAMAQFYAKAQIPKPVLAEANFLMRTLSDDDQAFMRRQLLVGLEDFGPSSSRIASELARLAAGEGHRFRVYSVASAGMKDGSVTLPLISSVQVYKGQRLRFYVREPEFASKEINALWLGYQQRKLNAQFTTATSTSDDGNNKEPATTPVFTPGACWIIPTLDRGNKFFQGQKVGYESSTASQVLSNVQCISGFFSNGVVGSIMDFSSIPSSSLVQAPQKTRTGIQGSASGYFLMGSWSGRPIYSASASAAAEVAALKYANENVKNDDDNTERNYDKRVQQQEEDMNKNYGIERVAPRAGNGELILKRREVHSGRALTVSTIEWSVAEKAARPSSTLEGYMWDKETEVDRFRERVPLSNLVSQYRLSLVDPASAKPRDWIGPIKQAIAASDRKFIVIPECKRIDPGSSGSIRRRYDVPKIIRDFTKAGVPAVSVNCDGVLFGGTLDHITTARAESSAAAVETSIQSIDSDGVLVPPILASDLLLYPYQLYKLRLAGADAVNIMVGALESKDLLYLTKIASSVQLQTLATVTSEVQLDSIATHLPSKSIDGIIISNRQLEDFSFDMTGEQALRLLKSAALKRLREKHGEDVLVLVEGRVGLIERVDESGTATTLQYVKEIKEAGAMGAIIGAGLATASSASETQALIESLQSV